MIKTIVKVGDLYDIKYNLDKKLDQDTEISFTY